MNLLVSIKRLKIKSPSSGVIFLVERIIQRNVIKRPVRKREQYLEIRNIIPQNITLTIFFMAIKIKDYVSK
jgi:hypothetical protein